MLKYLHISRIRKKNILISLFFLSFCAFSFFNVMRWESRGKFRLYQKISRQIDTHNTRRKCESFPSLVSNKIQDLVWIKDCRNWWDICRDRVDTLWKMNVVRHGRCTQDRWTLSRGSINGAMRSEIATNSRGV